MKNAIKQIIIFLIILLSFTLIFTMNWLYDTFGNLTLDEIIFQLKVPMDGANSDFYLDYIQNALPFILLCSVGVFTLLFSIFRPRKVNASKHQKRKGAHSAENASLVIYKKFRVDVKYILELIISIVLLVIGLLYVANKTNLFEFIENQFSSSSLIQNEYVVASNVNLEFPENKRNLIYIYIESMEATFFSKENGGAFDESLIPELEELAEENISFSGADDLAGLYSLPGTTWTTGAMVAQTMGIPLKIPVEKNSYGEYDSFLPGATSVGEILKAEGYNQMLMVGSDVEFGGRSHLFKQHGDYEIFDLNAAIAEGKMTEEDIVWWGFSDKDLFEYAKEKIEVLAEKDEPFNFTMLTVDTHHSDGYLCEDCENKYEEQYFNVLACSSKRVKEFVDWIQKQDFYENTTIIICGDHPSMQAYTFDDIQFKQGYKRTVYNCIINSEAQTDNLKNKYCSTLDMFPTTLASIGVDIEGNRLGLGTNLFSDQKTIIGKYGLDYVKDEFKKTSRFYNKQFLYTNK